MQFYTLSPYFGKLANAKISGREAVGDRENSGERN